MYASTTTIATAVIALGASIAGAVPSLSVRGYGLCSKNADCEAGFTCEQQWKGNEWALPVSVCVYKAPKRDVQQNEARGFGLCSTDADCSGSLKCKQQWDGDEWAGAIKVCS